MNIYELIWSVPLILYMLLLVKMSNFKYQESQSQTSSLCRIKLTSMNWDWFPTCKSPQGSWGTVDPWVLCQPGSGWHWSRTACDWQIHAWSHLGCTCTGRPSEVWSLKWRRWQMPMGGDCGAGDQGWWTRRGFILSWIKHSHILQICNNL